MVEAGLLEECARFMRRPSTSLTTIQAHGYKELIVTSAGVDFGASEAEHPPLCPTPALLN